MLVDLWRRWRDWKLRYKLRHRLSLMFFGDKLNFGGVMVEVMTGDWWLDGSDREEGSHRKEGSGGGLEI